MGFKDWAIRYLVADTGSWLPGRHKVGKVLRVKVTRQQIENSPSIESHKPVSRQYEDEYHRYYGWPYYWQGDALWGMTAFRIVEPAATSLPIEQALVTANYGEEADAHLRSTQAVKGYHLQASDGRIIGNVCDFIIDDESWAIRQLVIKTGHRFSGPEMQIPTSKVDRISYDESTVFVNSVKEAVEQSPADHLVSEGAAN